MWSKGLAMAAVLSVLVGVEVMGQTVWYSDGGGRPIGSSWTPFNNGTTYYNDNAGRPIGSSWQPFRGADGGSILFESKDIASRFSEDGWVGAVENRDVKGMAGAAWNLKAVETILGKQDKKTTSEAMFKAAAEVALEQKNAAALAEIVALCPACKSYQDELKASGQSRGAASVVTMPQVVFPDLGAFNPSKTEDFKTRVDTMTQNLKPWETPFLSPDLVRYNFRGVSSPEAENVAIMANRGRQTQNPAMIAQAAVALAGKKSEFDVSYLNPKKLMEEATGLALVLNDSRAATQLLSIYGNEELGLKDSDKAMKLADELRAMSGSRSQPAGDAGVMSQLLKPSYVHIFNPGVPPGMTSDMK